MALCSAPCWAWPDDDVWGWGNKFWRWRIALLDLPPPESLSPEWSRRPVRGQRTADISANRDAMPALCRHFFFSIKESACPVQRVWPRISMCCPA